MKQYVQMIGLVALSLLVGANPAFAEGGEGLAGYLPIGIGLTLGIAALGGTLAQGKAISAGLDSIGRNPSAQGKIFVPMLVGLAFVESLVILSFAIAFLMLNS